MGHPWIEELAKPQTKPQAKPAAPIAPPVELVEPSQEKRRGVWFWIKETGLLPLRILGLMLVFALLVGAVGLWVLPDIAAKNDVDMTLLVFRLLDDEGPARPFHRLGYQDVITNHLLPLKPGAPDPVPGEPAPARDEQLTDEVVEVKQTPLSDGGFVYHVRFASGKKQNLRSTTAHTLVPKADLDASRQAVSRLYPPTDKTQWQEVLAWGESLFVSSWQLAYNPEAAPRQRFGGAPGGTEDEQLWCVWQVLKSGGAPEEDLFRLPELFREAFPSKEQQESALTWAGTLHSRLAQHFRARLEEYKASTANPTGRVARLESYRNLQTVLPPDTLWTRLWLLQQYVGLSPAARTAARDGWLGYFPESKHEQVMELGSTLAEQRRAKGDALPDAPEVLPVLCVFERLTGTDPDGPVCCAAMDQLPTRKMMQAVVQMAYPNDDIFYLLAAGDPLSLYAFFQHNRFYASTLTFFVLFLTFILGLGVQTALRWIAVPLLLGKKTRPLWDKHQEGRGDEPRWLWVLSTLLLAGVGCLVAPWSLSELIVIQIGSPLNLFLGSLMATAMGGTLIGIVRRLCGLFLIFFGVDLETTWADEILGIVFGSFILYHFGNDFVSIAIFVVSDFLPTLLMLLFHRLRRGVRRQPAVVPVGA